MRRFEIDRPAAVRRQRRHLRIAHDWPKKPVRCVCEMQVGRFRKTDGFDCGRPQCGVCHYNKVNRIPRRSDVRAAVELAEGMAEAS